MQEYNVTHLSHRQRGFTLIEALVALLIMAFSMLGLAGLQMVMARNAEMARQRSEATRLAEEKIEEYRAFNSIEAGTGLVAWDSLASSVAPEPITSGSNVTFSRSTTFGGTSADAKRTVQVTVSWTDRTGETKSVTLNSYIAKIDPAYAGALGFPLPGNGNIKRPKNRNLNIPIAATDIGGGYSSLDFNSYKIVFDNASGYVVKKCNSSITSHLQLDTCENYPAYILTGYISGDYRNSATGVNLSNLSGTSSHGSVDCIGGAVTTDYNYYLCVIVVPSEGAAWSGKVLLTGMATGGNRYVCRFQYAQTGLLTTNQTNNQPYSNVKESLDQQNYFINNTPCSSSSSTYSKVLHQQCTTSNADRATECPASPDVPGI